MGLGIHWGSREELLHPRDRHGRFRNKGLAKALARIADFLDRFNPRTFPNDAAAGSYAQNKAKPGRFNGGSGLPRLSADLQNANAALASGQMDPETQRFVSMMDASMIEAPDDMILTRTVPMSALGLGSGQDPELLEDRLFADHGYSFSQLGTPLQNPPGTVRITYAVPKGTRVAPRAEGGGDRGVFIDRDVPFRITQMRPDGSGGYTAMAVVEEKTPGQKPTAMTPGAPPAPAAQRQAGIEQSRQLQARRMGAGEAERQQRIVENKQGLTQHQETPEERAARRRQVLGQEGGGVQPAPTGVPEATTPVQPPAPAPEAPAPRTYGPNPQPAFKQAVQDAKLPAPSAGSRRSEWNKVYSGVVSGRRDPADALREIEADIATNRRRLDHLHEIKSDTDPELENDIHAQEALRDLIKSHFNLGEPAPAPEPTKAAKKVERKAAAPKAPAAPAKKVAKAAVPPKAAPAPAKKAAPTPTSPVPPGYKRVETGTGHGFERLPEGTPRPVAEPVSRKGRIIVSGEGPTASHATPTGREKGTPAPVSKAAPKKVNVSKEGREADIAGREQLQRTIESLPEGSKMRRDAEKLRDQIDQDFQDDEVVKDWIKGSGVQERQLTEAERAHVARVARDVRTGKIDPAEGARDLRTTGNEKLDKIARRVEGGAAVRTPRTKKEKIDELDSMTSPELKALAKQEGIRGYSKLNKEAIKKAIRDKRGGVGEAAAPEAPAGDAIDRMNVTDLRKAAKEAGIRGYSRMKKEDLQKVLRERRTGVAPEVPAPVKAAKKATSPAGAKFPSGQHSWSGHDGLDVTDEEEARFLSLPLGEQMKILDRLGQGSSRGVSGTRFGTAPEPDLKVSPERVAEIRTAIEDLPRGPAGYIALDALREQLGGRFPRAEVDHVLQKMTREEGWRLFPESNQKALTPRARLAAIFMGNQDRHTLSIGPRRAENRSIAEARASQAQIDTDRRTARAVAEIDERLGNSDGKINAPELTRTIDNMERSGQLDAADAEAWRQAVASGDPARLRDAIETNARAAGLRPIGSSAQKVPFNPKEHKLLNAADRPGPGESVEIVRQGHYDRDGNVLEKAIVQPSGEQVKVPERPKGTPGDAATARVLDSMPKEMRDQVLDNMTPKQRAAVRDSVARATGEILDPTDQEIRDLEAKIEARVSVRHNKNTGNVEMRGFPRDATADDIREAARREGMGDLAGDTPEEVMHNAFREMVARELATRKVAKAAKAAAPKRPAGAYENLDVREIGKGIPGLDSIPPGVLDGVQKDLDEGKKTPAAIGRELESVTRNGPGPSYTRAVLHGVGITNARARIRDLEKEEPSPERDRELEYWRARQAENEAQSARLTREIDARLALAERLKVVKRKRATAPKPEPATLTPKEEARAAEVADLAGVPEARIQARMKAQKEEKRPASDAGKHIVDLLGATSSRQEADALLEGKTRAELLDIAKAHGIPGASSMTKPNLRREIVDAAVGRRLDSIATRGFTGSRPGEGASTPTHVPLPPLGSIGGRPAPQPYTSVPAHAVKPGDRVLAIQNADGKWVRTSRKTQSTPITVSEIRPARLGAKQERGYQVVGRDDSGNEVIVEPVFGQNVFTHAPAAGETKPAKAAKAAKKAAPTATSEGMTAAEHRARAKKIAASATTAEEKAAARRHERTAERLETPESPRGPLKFVRPSFDSEGGKKPHDRPNADEPLKLRGGQMTGTGDMHADSEMGQLWDDLYRDDRTPNSLLNKISELAHDMATGDRPFADIMRDLHGLTRSAPDVEVAKRVQAAIAHIDSPEAGLPKLPEGTPDVVRNALEELHSIPTARKTGRVVSRRLDTSVLDMKIDAVRKIAAGDPAGFDELARRDLHESTDGAYRMWRLFDRMATDPAVRKWARESARRAREQSAPRPERSQNLGDFTPAEIMRMSIAELRDLASHRGISGAEDMKKDDLLEKLLDLLG